MTREEFTNQLESLDFHYDRYGEYNRDAYDNDQVRLEIFVDYYTVRMVWRLNNSHKLSRCYYVNREIKESELAVSIISRFIVYCVETYKVDISKYEEK